MTVSLLHTTQSTKPASARAGDIDGPIWNEEHTLTAATEKLLGTTALSTTVTEITIGSGLTLTGSTLSAAGSGGDMLASTYDPATISEQLVGLTATQTLTNKTLTAPAFDTYTSYTPGAGPTHTEGRVFYDSTKKALSYYNDEADVTVNMGQENVVRVRNTTGATITNGSAVYISGSAGANLPLVALAQANTEATAECIGLATHDIENNSNGYVTSLGTVGGLDTSSFTAGQELYLSTSVAGGLTATKPTSGFVTVIGYCLISNVSIGEIKVLIGVGSSDATVTTAANTQTLTNKTISSASNTITVTASNVSDFDTEVSNNTDVAANTSARHSAVTFAGTGTYISLSGQQITVDPITVSDISDIAANYQALDADTLKADTADQLTAAFTAAVDDDGTQSSGTYTPTVAAGSNYKKIVNAGAFTLAPPAAATGEALTLSLLVVNTTGAGAITTSGYTKVTGDSFTTTTTDEFLCRIEVFDIGGTEYSHLDVVALQ